MAVEVRLPKLGVEMEAARLAEWLAGEGAEVATEETLLTVETEKVLFEVPSPAAGLVHRVGEVDEEYEIGALLAYVAADRAEYEQLAAGGATANGRTTAEAPAAPVVEATPAAEPVAAAGAASEDRRLAATARRRGEPSASPIARRMASDHGLSLHDVEGSGPRGIIRRRDIERALAAQTAAPAAAAAPSNGGAPAGTTTPLSGMRRTIATRLHASLQEMAQLTDVREHDVTALVEARTAAAARADRLGYRLSYTDLFTKAAALALREVPVLNARLDGDRLTVFQDINIGMAVAIPDGLLVPVLRHADRMTLREISTTLRELIARARDRSASAEDLAGGTFTITNFGSYGTHFGTPIIPEGQAAILGIGAMVDRPVIRDGAVVAGKTMYTSVTIDHRVVDGESVGRFQSVLGEYLSDPALLLCA